MKDVIAAVIVMIAGAVVMVFVLVVLVIVWALPTPRPTRRRESRRADIAHAGSSSAQPRSTTTDDQRPAEARTTAGQDNGPAERWVSTHQLSWKDPL
jgi:hypothetical protein